MIRLRQIKINNYRDLEEIKNKISKILKINKNSIKEMIIKKESIDARMKPNLKFIYEVDIEVANEERILINNKSNDVFLAPNEEYSYKITGTKKLNTRPVIIGSGPAGLMAAYLLSLEGFKPIIYERGEKVEERIKSIDKFWEHNELNVNSNVQFGEGGAGTFSDGKLNTLIKDKNNRMKKTFELFVECGAPEEILYSNKPHIGTDILRNVIINLRKKIISMGGEINYNSCLNDLEIENNCLKKIKINNEWQNCEVLILAIGHSARDTFRMLYDKNININSKPFAVGLRIEHPQEFINISQYGTNYNEKLPSASYKLTTTTSNNRGVYTFCMCPGGYVVNASSNYNALVVNGMSNYKRDTKVANSAIIVTITDKDYGKDPLGGIKYQEELEKKAFEIGKGFIPIQLLKDYYNNKLSASLGNVESITKGKCTFANLNELFSDSINNSIKEGINNFDKKIKGFKMDDAILLGVESRTSSPIRIYRNEYYESNIEGIMPCGEGAGYAGGITSSAVDGLKVAEAILEKYSL